MDFDAVLAHVIGILQREGRTSYRALKRQFALDDAFLDLLVLAFQHTAGSENSHHEKSRR